MNNEDFKVLLTKVRKGEQPAISCVLHFSQLRELKRALKAKKRDIDAYYDYARRSRSKLGARPRFSILCYLSRAVGILRSKP